jgi:hypothetical protein
VYILTLWKSPYMTHKLDCTMDQDVPKVKLRNGFYWKYAILNLNRNYEIVYGIQGDVFLQSFSVNQYGWKLELHGNFNICFGTVPSSLQMLLWNSSVSSP